MGTEEKLSRYTTEEKSWIMQDWANSAYSIMITTAVFPLYFKSIAESGGLADADSTAYLGICECGCHAGCVAACPCIGSCRGLQRLSQSFVYGLYVGRHFRNDWVCICACCKLAVSVGIVHVICDWFFRSE